MTRWMLPLAAGLVLMGCAGSSDKTPDGVPALSVSPELIEFGVVGIDTTESATFSINNTGGGELSVLSVTLSSGDVDIWAVERLGDAVVAGGASTEVEVRFSPDREEQNFGGEVQVRVELGNGQESAFVALTGSGGVSTEDNDGDGYSRADGDCDDNDDTRFPGNPEICDGRDNDCNGSVPADEADDDSDGFRLCGTDPDCDDADANVYPGAPEICDNKDSNCDGVNADTQDSDNDGFSACDGDCDDAEPDAFPGNTEVCDGVDNDCDGATLGNPADGIDNLDADGDGFSVCDAAGDCNDNDPQAYPLVVSTSGSSGAVGSDADPLDSLAEAFANLDTTCRTIYIEPGAYELGESISGDVSLIGRGTSADVELTAPADERLLEVTAGDVSLSRLTLTGGNPQSTPQDGGALRIAGGTVTLDRVVLRGNTTPADGGAVFTSGTLNIGTGVVFENNSAGDDGGAIATAGGSVTTTAGGTVFRGNDAASGGALYFGGGGTHEIYGATVTGNVASADGGGLATAGAVNLTLFQSDFLLNSAAGSGGGLAFRDVALGQSAVSNLRVQDNEAAAGGGVAILGATASGVFANMTFVANDATGEGAGMLVDVTDGSGLRVWANIVAFNDGLSGLTVSSGDAADVRWNTGYSTTSLVDLGGEASVDPTNVANQDPLFAAFSPDSDPSNDDLSLRSGSPAIDSGIDQAAFNDVDGTQNDRGYLGGPRAEQ